MKDKDTFKVVFRKTAYVHGRGHSWAEYSWNPQHGYWSNKDGNRSEGFFDINPEFSPYMSNEKMLLWSLK